MALYTLKFDGGSTGNPGLSGAGSVIYLNDEEIWAGSYYVGNMETNNTAEYHGVIHGLEEAVNMNITNLKVYGDSALVINQITGKYKVKSDHLKILYDKVMVLIGYFETITFNHIPRNQNKRADQLSNIGRIIK
jgi:ribonuclease HI